MTAVLVNCSMKCTVNLMTDYIRLTKLCSLNPTVSGSRREGRSSGPGLVGSGLHLFAAKSSTDLLGGILVLGLDNYLMGFYFGKWMTSYLAFKKKNVTMSPKCAKIQDTRSSRTL